MKNSNKVNHSFQIVELELNRMELDEMKPTRRADVEHYYVCN